MIMFLVELLNRIGWVMFAYTFVSIARIFFNFDQYGNTLFINTLGLIGSLLIILLVYFLKGNISQENNRNGV